MESVLDETNVFETFRKIINFKLIDTDTIDITVGTFALLLIVLILTSFLLKLIRGRVEYMFWYWKTKSELAQQFFEQCFSSSEKCGLENF